MPLDARHRSTRTSSGTDPTARNGLGQLSVASRNREQDLADIRKRYLADYQAEWRKALQMVSVPRPGNVLQSAARLGKLGGAQSPLLAILALAASSVARVRVALGIAAASAAWMAVRYVPGSNPTRDTVSDCSTPGWITSGTPEDASI